MPRNAPARWWVEVVLAGLSATLLLLTLALPQWIEALGVEPDGGSGSAEWGLVALLVASTAVCSALARLEWVRAARQATSGRP